MTEPTDSQPTDAEKTPSADSPVLPVAGQPQAAPQGAGTDESTEDGSGNRLLDALEQVIDLELMINIVDLGLIYEVDQVDATVNVDMTLTSPACPAGPQIMQQAKMALERLDDVSEAKIQLVMSPPWSPDRMTDDARDQLGIF